jgi:hypothetical protein
VPYYRTATNISGNVLNHINLFQLDWIWMTSDFLTRRAKTLRWHQDYFRATWHSLMR